MRCVQSCPGSRGQGLYGNSPMDIEIVKRLIGMFKEFLKISSPLGGQGGIPVGLGGE